MFMSIKHKTSAAKVVKVHISELNTRMMIDRLRQRYTVLVLRQQADTEKSKNLPYKGIMLV